MLFRSDRLASSNDERTRKFAPTIMNTIDRATRLARSLFGDVESKITLKLDNGFWRSRTDDQSPGTLGQDLATLPGTAQTALAVPPGDYSLEVAIGTQTVAATFAGTDGSRRLFTVRLPR